MKASKKTLVCAAGLISLMISGLAMAQPGGGFGGGRATSILKRCVNA